MSNLVPVAEHNVHKRECTFETCGVIRMLRRSDDAWTAGSLDIGLRFTELATRLQCDTGTDICGILSNLRFATLLADARRLEHSRRAYDASLQRLMSLKRIDSLQRRKLLAIAKIVESIIRMAGARPRHLAAR
jgi:hypothetical protein